MSWIFGTVNFSDYGVNVARSHGVLDLPTSQLTGTNWLDEDGIDYWETTPLFNDREIVLNCWISTMTDQFNTGYEIIQQRIRDFETDIQQEKTTLVTPFATLSQVSFSAGIQVNRTTNYVANHQAVTFSLKFTVHGDSKLRALTVSRGNSTAGTIYYGPDAKIVKRLGGEQYFTCTSEQIVTSTFQRGDSVTVDITPGFDAEPYYLDKDPEIRKLSTNKYSVNYQFVVDYQKLRNVQFRFSTTGETDFYWFANLSEIIEAIITNADRVYSGLFQAGVTSSTERRNHKFSGESCYDVLVRMCSEYDMEFNFTYNDPVWELTVTEKIERSWPYTLKYGRGEGLYELTRQAVNKEELCTVLYAFGSERNIKATYTRGTRRLSFAANPLSQNTGIYGQIERTVFFDDILPQRTATITGYYQVLKEDLTDQQEITWPNGIYRVEDSSLEFDLNDYLAGNLTAKIRFKTGLCAGYEFEIGSYDHENRWMYIIPFEDEIGYIVPNATIKPATGDQYTLVDIDQPSTYYTVAESELQAAAQTYLDEHSTPRVTYRVVVDPGFMQNNFAGLESYRGFNVGDVIGVIDSDLGMNDLFRVSELTKDYYKGGYELILSDARVLTNREKASIRLDAVERSLRDIRANMVENMRKGDPTTGEVITRVFNPIDSKQDTDRTIRNESIDARMLGYDAGVPQFTINGLIVETNFEDLENRVKITAGKVIILNWGTLTKDRYEIWKMQQANQKYDPSRTWTIDETIINLETSDGYFLYVKLPRNEEITTGTLIVNVENIYIKDNPDYIIYMLGYINAPASPRVATMLWGNIKPGARRFLELLDVYAPDLYQGQDGKIPVVDEANNRLILVDPPEITGQIQSDWNQADTGAVDYIKNKPTVPVNTDETVKYDAADPTAGYLSEKIVAGTGIEINEGTGANENKLVISASVVGGGSEVIEFGFCDAADVSSWDLDINAEFAYTIVHAWLRTDTGTLTGVNVKINATAVSGIDNCSVSGTKAQFTATGNNSVVVGDTVTLNITPATPEYIGGHILIQRT